MRLKLEHSKYGAIVETVCAMDKRFFDEHEDYSAYWREMVQGEMHPVFDGAEKTMRVCVVRVTDGVRMRIPVPRAFALKLESIGMAVLPPSPKTWKGFEYKDYLQTKHWKELRAKVLERAEHRCELCYSSKALNVHHKTYMRLGDEKLSDLIVLCRDCHSKFHGKLP